MTFRVTDRDGGMEFTDDVSVIDDLLADLDRDDPEHPDVAVASGDWSLSIYGDGAVSWQNLEEGGPRHLTGLSREELAQLARTVATGDLDAVESYPWRPGYP